ncbi:MAG: RNA polymerase-binding protein DksA [Alphaproteobacteria bacterium]|nr:RNA polymerase-binding protein DksA [Alphaproteobacteria bacterium]
MSDPTSPQNFPEDEYLSAEEIKTMWDILEQQLQEILSESREDLQYFTEQREVDPDELDLAVTESNRDFALRLADRERRLLRKIKNAMTRIQNGEYGTCESCGAAISFARLMARPVATQCIDCKTEMEQLERPKRAFIQ